MRRRSWLFKLANPLFAILAVWCLGCTSLDPLLDFAFGNQTRSQASCMTSDTGGNAEQGVAFSAAPVSDRDGFADACGCSHCVGVQASAASVSPLSPPQPEVAVEKLGRALRADPKPLVPPPQVSVVA